MRLAKSAVRGIEELRVAVRLEKILMRTAGSFECIKVPANVEFSEDKTAAEILKSCGRQTINSRMPVRVKGDGNCLFNAISLAVCGDETRSGEIRARTTIEIIDQCDWYMSQHDNTDLNLVSPDFNEVCLYSAIPGKDSSVMTMYAASSVVNREIISVYPSVNGMLDKCIGILNTKIIPRCEGYRQDPIYIMWSGNLKEGG
ncbi:vertnin-like [Procambarus clarkii]|uniref:vertnin-like n=1 Tax=Procambarus clarkii TaxID=6728 RepID=UPI0037423A67